jgi:hypothetical protein
MGDFSCVERGHIFGASLAGTSVTKTAMLLAVWRATVSKVLSPCTNHGKTSGKRNRGRKSTMTERDCRILGSTVSKNHKTTAAYEHTELNIHLEETSTKTIRRELHKSNIHDRAAIAKPLITVSNVPMSKGWFHEHKN